MVLILNFLNTLKRLGRYHDSTILIHAGTGAEEGFLADPPDYRSPRTTLSLPDNVFLSGAKLLLMIKQPGHKREFRENEHASQLVDFFPSLLDILDLQAADTDAIIHGRSVFGEHRNKRDVRVSLDPEKRWGDNHLDVRIENPLDLTRSALTVIGTTIEPVHWRSEVRQRVERQLHRKLQRSMRRPASFHRSGLAAFALLPDHYPVLGKVAAKS